MASGVKLLSSEPLVRKTDRDRDASEGRAISQQRKLMQHDAPNEQIVAWRWPVDEHNTTILRAWMRA